MFTSVLIANRGEIAVRVLRTLRRMGIRGVAVYSDADTGARHVREADTAVRLGPAPPAQSYLNVDAVVAAAVASGAEAIHPGYGFLSENAALAAACAAAGIVFIGPPPAAIEAMGDKIRAKATVSAAGVPVVPGRSGAGLTAEDLAAAALEVGLPVLLKPSAGGGGKGMRRVDDATALAREIAAARREARAAFGDDTLLVERWVQRPRHIEIQVLFDGHGHGLHLAERECSLQRRHQKVVEEAPSVLLDEATRAAMGASAVEAARAVGYVGAGTVEFIVSTDRPDEYFFMEMNTRLQVEHPVTEAVTGLDLVEWQLRVAAGETLEFDQEDVAIRGHAVEARVYAEDPARGFLPASGRLLVWREPDAGHAGVRVDSGVASGDEVGTAYDPMLAKVVARGRDRREALARLHAALGSTLALGVTTNIDFLRRLVSRPEVLAGSLDTGLIERHLPELSGGVVPDEVLAAAAFHRLLRLEPPRAVADPWDRPTGWRLGGPPAEDVIELTCGDHRVEVGVTGPPTDALVRIGGGEPVRAAACLSGRSGDPEVLTLELA
ncbi:ATP-grasp domain-containing protein, partial [Acidimicrobiaceae bacterium USS-CC1]|nr:ATP-grasp domain-containing protein [Acidiferrimicrobium australe]